MHGRLFNIIYPTSKCPLTFRLTQLFVYGEGGGVAVVLALFLTQKLLLTSRQLKRATIRPHTWRLQPDNGGLCRVPSQTGGRAQRSK